MNTAPDFEILRVEKVRKLFLKYVKLFLGWWWAWKGVRKENEFGVGEKKEEKSFGEGVSTSRFSSQLVSDQFLKV